MVPPPGGAQMGNGGLAAVGGGQHVDAEDLLPVLARGLGQRPIDAHAGHVHQAMEGAEMGDGVGHRALRRGLLGDVGHDRHRPGPGDRRRDILDRALRGLATGVHQGHRRTFLGEEPRRRPADAAATSGDEGHMRPCIRPAATPNRLTLRSCQRRYRRDASGARQGP